MAHDCPDCRCHDDPVPPPHFCSDPHVLPVPRGCPDRNGHLAANWDAVLDPERIGYDIALAVNRAINGATSEYINPDLYAYAVEHLGHLRLPPARSAGGPPQLPGPDDREPDAP